MTEGDHLIGSCKDHIVVTHNGTAAHGRNADFVLITAYTLCASVIFVMIAFIHSLVDRISQGQCSAARRIQLLVVMFLHNLDVKAGICQNLCASCTSFMRVLIPRDILAERRIAVFLLVSFTFSICSGESPVVHSTNGILCAPQ